MNQRNRSVQAARHRARRLVIQALYQWQVGGDEPNDIVVQFLEHRVTDDADADYFREIMRSLIAGLTRIDEAIEPLLERSLAMVDPVERGILRLAACELLERYEVPAAVVIDEAVELAREFGADQGHRFVNGVVDRLARGIRTHELGPPAASS